MHDEMNRKTAEKIAEGYIGDMREKARHSLSDDIYTALQIAEKRGEVVEKHRSSNATGEAALSARKDA